MTEIIQLKERISCLESQLAFLLEKIPSINYVTRDEAMKLLGCKSTKLNQIQLHEIDYQDNQDHVAYTRKGGIMLFSLSSINRYLNSNNNANPINNQVRHRPDRHRTTNRRP